MTLDSAMTEGKITVEYQYNAVTIGDETVGVANGSQTKFPLKYSPVIEVQPGDDATPDDLKMYVTVSKVKGDAVPVNKVTIKNEDKAPSYVDVEVKANGTGAPPPAGALVNRHLHAPVVRRVRTRDR